MGGGEAAWCNFSLSPCSGWGDTAASHPLETPPCRGGWASGGRGPEADRKEFGLLGSSSLNQQSFCCFSSPGALLEMWEWTCMTWIPALEALTSSWGNQTSYHRHSTCIINSAGRCYGKRNSSSVYWQLGEAWVCFEVITQLHLGGGY